MWQNKTFITLACQSLLKTLGFVYQTVLNILIHKGAFTQEDPVNLGGTFSSTDVSVVTAFTGICMEDDPCKRILKSVTWTA